MVGTLSFCANLFFYVILSQSSEEAVDFGLVTSVAWIAVSLKPKIHFVCDDAEFFKQPTEGVNVEVVDEPTYIKSVMVEPYFKVNRIAEGSGYFQFLLCFYKLWQYGFADEN